MPSGPGSPLRRWLLLGLIALLVPSFAALSAWQWKRLAWKESLIERVDQQLARSPGPAPGPADWPQLTRDNAEYRPVLLDGAYAYRADLRVLASTELGRGYWLLRPLRTSSGWWVWVNRGFVPETQMKQPGLESVAAPARVQGLLRWTEPDGLPWARNDPAAGRWTSRDVAAMTAQVGLDGPVAPYFVDARPETSAAMATDTAYPRAGLTVVHFSNNHLQYALTWLALAVGALAAGLWVWRDDRRSAAD